MLAPDIVIDTGVPTHIEGTAGVDDNIGSVNTFTVSIAVFLHPVAVLVPVTVYVVVVTGLAVTRLPVVVLSPVAGLHVYVFAPAAVKFTDVNLHISGFNGVTETGGRGLTVILAFPVSTQPKASVPVTT